MKRTVLFEEHELLGAKFTEFGGWEMPVRYSGVNEEHLTVRSAAGLFDVSHMGEVFARGLKALDFLEYATTNTVSSLDVGEAQYSMLLNERGGVVDDIIVYRLAEQNYLLCVNASNAEKDFSWLKKLATSSDWEEGLELENASADFAQIAIQGPKAEKILCEVLRSSAADFAISAFPAFHVKEFEAPQLEGVSSVIVARTGYTGEDGFEVFLGNAGARQLWRELLAAGAGEGIKPIGLAARDTLRLEACYPLHGHEISDDISPLTAGLGWVVKLDKKDFFGAEILRAQKEAGLTKKLVALKVRGAGIVREETPILAGEEVVGRATSGTKVPTQDAPIALALVDKAHAKSGTMLLAEVRNRRFEVEVVKKPIYKRS